MDLSQIESLVAHAEEIQCPLTSLELGNELGIGNQVNVSGTILIYGICVCVSVCVKKIKSRSATQAPVLAADIALLRKVLPGHIGLVGPDDGPKPWYYALINDAAKALTEVTTHM